MNGFQEIKGYVMYKDIPVVRFDYNGGMLTNAKVLVDKKYLPIEYKAMVSDHRATELFLSDRVVPSSRQLLQPALERVGIPYYDPDMLIRYNKGVSVEDEYWIKLDE